MSARHPEPITDAYLLEGGPSAFLKENFGRYFAASNCAALATGVMTAVALPLRTGQTVTSLTFVSGATAAGTPTHWWFALYSNAATPALLAQSADQTSGAWAAHTAKTLALATPQLVTADGIYYAAVMVTATTPPTLEGITLENAVAAGAIVTGMAVLAQTSGSALAASAPATIATPTTVATVPYVVAQ